MTANQRDAQTRCRGDRGDSLVSVLMLMPVLVMMLELVVVGGRVAATQADVQAAAREAARDASIAQSWSSASTAMNAAVDTALADKGFSCTSHDQYFGAETHFYADANGRVEIVVNCTVDLSDLGFLPVPGSHTVTARATEPIDRYRVVE